MWILSWYWDTVRALVAWFLDAIEVTPSAGLVNIGSGIITLVVLGSVWGFIKRFAWRIFRFFRPKRSQYPEDYRSHYVPGQPDGDAPPPSAPAEGTVAQLKADKDWGALAQLFASQRRFADAAKYFRKAGDQQSAAHAWARAGKAAKAARILMKLGEFAQAGRLYEDNGDFKRAVAAYEKANEMADAAVVYAKNGKIVEAVTAFDAYFSNTRDPLDKQFRAAEACLALIESDVGKAQVPPAQRKALMPVLAARFEGTDRLEGAANLYYRAGLKSKAGDLLVQLGRLEDAAKVLREAGEAKEASRILGRHYEEAAKWKEAAEAYTAGGNFKKAGECYNKCGEHSKAAENYAKADEHYLAGLSFAHASRFRDAIIQLQKVKEANPNFDASRALLGRCFYEEHDFEHCAAALENHLTGKRVESGNAELFYMLATAYEHMGKLENAREILYKIRTVNIGYKDVSQKISNISSRIVMKQEGAQWTPAPGVTTPAPGDRATRQMDDLATKMMEAVESTLDGRYALEVELGRGGMGVVYKARDVQLDRPVALKFLGSAIDNNEEFRQRFIREAQTAARINHPNIIAIYEISPKAGKAYIAMEFVEGGSLQRLLKQRGKLGMREAVNLVSQACSALAAVHEAGIVHRDIKPDNILIAKGGLVKLMDFGLAKSEDNRMTRTGVIMGTPSYMSPEQVLGKDADARSDIYSMGLVLYECLSGETVFREGNVMERQLQEMPPPPSSQVPEVPPALDELVLRCVQKKPEDRFQTMKDVVQALRTVLQPA